MENSSSDKTSPIHDGFQDFTEEELTKYQKYEADFASYLRSKYFSNKDIHGGDIFDLKVDLGDETIKASRWSPTRSYADPGRVNSSRPVAAGAEQPSALETSASVSNGNITPETKSS